MKTLLLATSLVLLGTGASLAPSAAFAADAANPYGNIDHSNDMGNNTGDSQVPSLNAQQLNRNYAGPLEVHHPDGTTTLAPAQPNTQPPPMAQPTMAPPPPPGPIAR